MLRRWDHPFYKIGIALSAGVLALVASEAFCRVFMPASRSIRFEQDIEELQGIGLSRLASVFEDDSELFWRFAPNQTLPTGGPFFGVISNDAGMREDHPVSLEKPASEFRVLFLGDSCTFGYGLDQKYRPTRPSSWCWYGDFVFKLRIAEQSSVPMVDLVTDFSSWLRITVSRRCSWTKATQRSWPTPGSPNWCRTC